MPSSNGLTLSLGDSTGLLRRRKSVKKLIKLIFLINYEFHLFVVCQLPILW